jgi:hypothetical protein
MMFFQAILALYLAAFALAAPGHGGPDVDAGGVGKSRVIPCSLCISLSTAVGVDNNEIAKNIGNNANVHY